MKFRTYLAAGLVLAALGGSAQANQAPEPTCAEVWDLFVEWGILPYAYDVHGQHILNDYVVGPDYAVQWPPSGSELAEILAGRGAAVPGGPGPGAHFLQGVAPGASFCTDSQSGGAHF